MSITSQTKKQSQTTLPVYLDCNATTPVDSRVSELVRHFMDNEFGNAGSRTHEFGARAKQEVQKARDRVAAVVKAEREEVIFTSGATESNNLAILGLAAHGRQTGRTHLITTQIEHKAVLEPLEFLAQHGFEVTLLPSTNGGFVDPDAVKQALRPQTLLVSVMHANNETGVLQPIDEIAQRLADHHAFFHVDAAQGFGKEIQPLQNPRLDFISISAHKIFGPKGVGALVVRRRGFESPPLEPLFWGGGQERGLRPGTLPVPLIVGFGLAAELALKENDHRKKLCMKFRQKALEVLLPLQPKLNGEQTRTMVHVLNLSFGGIDSEALMVALKSFVAISNGSACTSASYKPSHVLKAMGRAHEEIVGSVRISWCHETKQPDWTEVATAIQRLR
jgi:cysteine desulfurase